MDLYWIFFSIPSILIASSVHEFSHAWAAYKLGDLTAKINGRLTLNPLAHIDIFGAIMMVLTRFGWSKPVPINEHNFRNPVVGTALSALAGPVSNFILAMITAIVFRILPLSPVESGSLVPDFLSSIMLTFIIVNLSLALFNLIPIPPLDGHKIVRALLPESFRYQWEGLERYSRWLLLLLFLPFSPLSFIMNQVLSYAIKILLLLLLA
ncbi:MAG: site-2 protease family protein [Patescibacteria group bacterium]|nr:site-2 protease family protein [Patescibacteria group bacterium]